jgi:hypothetical protein
MKGRAIKKALMEYEGSMGEESYKSPKAKMKHEKGESKRAEFKEKMMSKFKKKK